MSTLGSKAPNFKLKDTKGHWVSLSEYTHPALLVIFMCNHCPFVIHIHDNLLQWIHKYQAKGLGVVAINANDAIAYPQDGPVAMKQIHEENSYSFAYLFDEDQSVAQAYDAACTPDFFLYDNQRHLVYRGQFDESRPGKNIPVTGQSLSLACDALLQQGSIPSYLPQLPSIGCNIKWKN